MCIYTMCVLWQPWYRIKQYGLGANGHARGADCYDVGTESYGLKEGRNTQKKLGGVGGQEIFFSGHLLLYLW